MLGLAVTTDRVTAESIDGYLMRVATYNGFRDWRPLKRALKPAGWYQFNAEECGRLVAGCSGENIDQIGYALRPSGYFSFGKASVARRLINLTYRRVCAECLDENGHAFYLWELKTYTACHVHKRRLRDHCDECGQIFTWRETTLFACQCRRIVQPRDDARVSDCELELCTRMAAEAQVTWTPSGSVPDLALGTLALWFFASDPGKVTWYPTMYGALPVDVAASMTTLVADVLLEWPKGIHRWLDELAARWDVLPYDAAARFPFRLKNTFGRVDQIMIDIVGEHLDGRPAKLLDCSWEKVLPNLA